MQNKNQKRKKEKFKREYASSIFLQVVGSGAPGAPRSLYVFTDCCRYFFNCGEGTQRLSSEHKIKLSVTEHIFITHKSWENVGGLLGSLLTLQDAGVQRITVHGPPGTESILNDTKHFTRFSSLQINHYHYDTKKKILEEGPIHIQVVPIRFDESSVSDHEIVTEQLSKTAEPELETMSHINCENSSQIIVNESKLLEGHEFRDLSLAYICHPTPKPGALLPNRCRELGVPLGPLMGELKNGKDICLSDGIVVKSKDVTEPPDKGVTFIVIEVHKRQQLCWLANCEDFTNFQGKRTLNTSDVAGVVVHFTPSNIVQDPIYQKWIDDFGPFTQHIYINDESECMGSESVHKIQFKLNHLYPNSFPILSDASRITSNTHDENALMNHSRKKLKSCFKSVKDKDQCEEPEGTHWQGTTCMTYHIRPHLKIDLTKQIKINPQELVEECENIEGFKSTLDKVNRNIIEAKKTISVSVMDRRYPIVLFLGTGSCIPNKTRNTSGIALYIKLYNVA